MQYIKALFFYIILLCYIFIHFMIIRSVIFNFVFWPTFTLYITIIYPFAYFMNRRQTYKYVFRIVTRWLVFCLRIFVKLNYKIVKKEFLYENTPVIIACNHQSTWETFIFSLLFEELAIVIKKELLTFPIAGLYFKRLGCIAIDRENGASAIKTLIKQGKAAIDENVSILIFPNGTRASINEAEEYKSGVFALYKFLNVPVVNVHIDSGKFWPKRSFIKHPGTITVKCSKQIENGFDKETFMNMLKDTK